MRVSGIVSFRYFLGFKFDQTVKPYFPRKRIWRTSRCEVSESRAILSTTYGGRRSEQIVRRFGFRILSFELGALSFQFVDFVLSFEF